MTKWFARYTRREGIADKSLRDAIKRVENGMIDADLGGGLVKQRVARPGKGRSGGYRMIVAFRTQHRAVFLFGFAKSELDNIGHDKLLSLRSAGLHWLNAHPKAIQNALEDHSLEEVDHDKKE